MLAQSTSIAVTVLMLASLGTFFASSRAEMTARAIGSVPVDWQVLVTSGADPGRVTRTVANSPGVMEALPVEYADSTGLASKTGATVHTTGAGRVLGIPDGYAATFPGEIRPLVGADHGVLLAQQTAANLGAGVGSSVAIHRPGQEPVTVNVDGVVDLPAADSLFQSIGVIAGAAPTAPPDNVVLLPAATWQRMFAHAAAGTATTEVHVSLSHDLPTDPASAFGQIVGRAKNLEAALAGGGLVGDNLAAQLDGARSDAIYAELLFLFLGLPGVIIAALLAGVIAASGGERRRREQSLLRIRGASTSIIVRLAAGEALVCGTVGTIVGLAGAIAVGGLVFGASRFGATPAQATLWAAVSAIFGPALAGVIVVAPAAHDARALTVRAASATEASGGSARPRWTRVYPDLVLVGSGALVYWHAVRNGYQVVLAPEGVPTISVDSFTLLAPVLFWLGASLLMWRFGATVLRAGRTALEALTRPLAHRLSGVVAASMSRQHRTLTRGLVMIGLTTSFAISVAIFNTTYDAQARVDAQLTNGADVTVTTAAAAGLPPGIGETIARLPGVTATQTMQHRFAYVGNDLQDLYGIDPATIGSATSVSDAYFANGSAAQTLRALAAAPDAVLVSEETVHDFQLQPGDTLRLRLQFASDHRYHAVPFSYVGVVREFPTAPRDSFLVANATYVAAQTGSPAAQTLLIRTASPSAVASEVRGILGAGSGATVQDITSARQLTLSSLTAIDLAGLTKLELSFALVLAAAASGLVLALGLAERRRTSAIATALGATGRQLGGFVWSEAAFVSIGGLALGAISGWWLALVIVRILTGVFDPPPQHLAVPWPYLVAFVGATVTAVLAAGAGMLRATRRPALMLLRDL